MGSPYPAAYEDGFEFCQQAHLDFVAAQEQLDSDLRDVASSVIRKSWSGWRAITSKKWTSKRATGWTTC
jgi:hypothetical protein